MAWAVKPSASIEIEQRSEPWLTDSIRKVIDTDIVPRYACPRGALMPALHLVQTEYGYIAPQAMVEIAEVLGITPAQVADVVSFYEQYHDEPVGEHVIGVCQSIACEIRGSQALIDHLKNKLDIGIHETTEDGKFTLLAMECLGACDTAPCALVGEGRRDNLTISEVDRIVKECK